MERNCLICNKVFPKPYKLSKRQWAIRKYCSLECFYTVTPLKKKGRRPWNYKGISSVNALERNKFRKEVQKLVLKRDNYTCQICFQYGGVLQVDHIQPWSEYVLLRFDMKNCRTLCVKCHYKITYGRPMPPEIRAWGQHMFKGEKNL